MQKTVCGRCLGGTNFHSPRDEEVLLVSVSSWKILKLQEACVCAWAAEENTARMAESRQRSRKVLGLAVKVSGGSPFYWFSGLRLASILPDPRIRMYL